VDSDHDFKKTSLDLDLAEIDHLRYSIGRKASIFFHQNGKYWKTRLLGVLERLNSESQDLSTEWILLILGNNNEHSAESFVRKMERIHQIKATVTNTTTRSSENQSFEVASSQLNPSTEIQSSESMIKTTGPQEPSSSTTTPMTTGSYPTDQ